MLSRLKPGCVPNFWEPYLFNFDILAEITEKYNGDLGKIRTYCLLVVSSSAPCLPAGKYLHPVTLGAFGRNRTYIPGSEDRRSPPAWLASMFYGDSGKIRTCCLLVRSQALYPNELRSLVRRVGRGKNELLIPLHYYATGTSATLVKGSLATPLNQGFARDKNDLTVIFDYTENHRPVQEQKPAITTWLFLPNANQKDCW